MRYQQVYSASLFTNVPPEYVYITRFGYNYYPDTNCAPDFSDWGMKLQINLSTTPKAVNGLSTNFSENVGSDDVVVFGPAQIVFPNEGKMLFDQPFRYDPAQGNLLLDVRVWDATGTFAPGPSCRFGSINNVYLWAVDSPTNVSRVWATNVNAAVATDGDTTGLLSWFQFTPVPSLVIYTLTTNVPTNYIVIDWPSQPSVFQLQQSAKLGAGAVWQTITNTVGPRYYFPIESAGSKGFFQLVWPSSQPVQPATAPVITVKRPETPQRR